ncbi:MAG: GxxExxY protein [Ignavibacteria bacterium]|nr:GxxExxY protein [Ignavibacteria bacterium]
MTEDELSNIIIGCALKVHKVIGPGLLESVYEECLYHEIRKNNLNVSKQVPIPLFYEDVRIDCSFRADLIVEDKVIIEIKSIKKLEDIHIAQILSYLRISKIKLGLLFNFNEILLMNGFKRVVNNL